IVVDAGPADARWDAGARVVVPFLRRAGARRVDLLVLSHAHRDHVGGAEAVLDAFPVGALLEPGEPFEEAAYRRVLERAAQRGVRWHVGVTGASWTIDGVTFRIVHPGRRWTGRGIDLNDDSVVLEVRWGEFVALFAGDAGERAEPSYLTALGPVDLLKVGHHGSRTATGEALLARIRPEAAVVSLGRNRYGHPAPETMARLAAARTRVWRTDREGPVTMTTDGRTFTVRGERTHATFDAADP
ncbi:MAG: MBL fold metallo-hydrolase, partial [Gemmatimonadetes bacterium]|nr:MBL fold metallo-hydrolase [Gemmatimonadota bacterium]